MGSPGSSEVAAASTAGSNRGDLETMSKESPLDNSASTVDRVDDGLLDRGGGASFSTSVESRAYGRGRDPFAALVVSGAAGICVPARPTMLIRWRISMSDDRGATASGSAMR